MTWPDGARGRAVASLPQGLESKDDTACGAFAPKTAPPGQTGPQLTAHLLALELLGSLRRKDGHSLRPGHRLEKDLCLTSRQLSTENNPGDRCAPLFLFSQQPHRRQPSGQSMGCTEEAWVGKTLPNLETFARLFPVIVTSPRWPQTPVVATLILLISHLE